MVCWYVHTSSDDPFRMSCMEPSAFHTAGECVTEKWLWREGRNVSDMSYKHQS